MARSHKHKPSSPITLQWMGADDVGSLLIMDKEGSSRPWCQADFDAVLKSPTLVGIVARRNGRFVGYAIYDTFHQPKLHRLIVSAHARRRGIGSQLIEHMIRWLDWKSPYLDAIVEETERSQQDFLRSCGFTGVKVVRQPFNHSSSDGYLMRLTLMSREEVIFQAIDRLERLTGLQWELAKYVSPGHIVPIELPEDDGFPDSGQRWRDVVLRPRAIVRDPKAACETVNNLWMCDARREVNAVGTVDVVVPVASLSQALLCRGDVEELAVAFSTTGKPWRGSASGGRGRV